MKFQNPETCWTEFTTRFAELNPEFERKCLRFPTLQRSFAALQDSILRSSLGARFQKEIHACGLFNMNPRRYLYLSIDSPSLDSPVAYALTRNFTSGIGMATCSACLIQEAEYDVTFDVLEAFAVENQKLNSGISTIFLVPRYHSVLRYALVPIHDDRHPLAKDYPVTGMVIVPNAIDSELTPCR